MRRQFHNFFLGVFLLGTGDLAALPWEKVGLQEAEILIARKKGCTRHLLVLHGWNLGAAHWPGKSDIIAAAWKQGYCLYFPEMKKSVYESRFFPETKRREFSVPGMEYLTTTVLDFLRLEYKAFLPGGNNYGIGISTGGRGMVLLAHRQPKIFCAVASLSGDYNQSLNPDDKLMTAAYGPYQKNSYRWNQVDNPSKLAGDWKTPLYIGHGEKDNVVSINQAMDFHNRLQTYSSADVFFHRDPAAGHNLAYWNSEISPVLKFFAAHECRHP